MIEERSALPESIGELFDTAFAAYGKRVRFYLAIAVAAFLLQGAVVVASIALHLAPLTAERILLLVSVFVDAFVMGAVSIGIVADVSGAQIADTGTLFVTSLFRWPLLIAVFSLQSVIVIVTSVALFGGGVGTFLLFVLPVALMWGTLGFPTVACSIDDTQPIVLRIFRSFAQSFQIALAPPNAGRTVLLGLAVLTPSLLETVLQDYMVIRHVPQANFWANVPVDALVVGPFQAVFAVFYLDFIRRYNAAQANR